MLYPTISALCARHPGKSGIHPVSSATEAFAVRAQLCQMARHTLDIQYYIWRQDLTGFLLLHLLLQAARRGVRLRLLLDDFATSGMDPALAVLNQYPNVEVRLVNPFSLRFPRWLNLFTDFSRLNRRMHNKSFSVDGTFTIVGGRNVGDEYFGAKDGDLFSDLDVVAIGPVVKEVAADFERYWNSVSTRSVSDLLPDASPRQIRQFEARLARACEDPRAIPYMQAAADPGLRQRWLGESGHYEWAHTQMLSDNPDKLRGKIVRDRLVVSHLHQLFGQPERHLELVSAYFVPTRSSLKLLLALARRGIAVQVLTNSLEATDVSVVHAAYSKYRKRLLKAGIVLYEMRRTQLTSNMTDNKKRKRRRLLRIFGSAGTSLHSKTLSIDGQLLFVGSFNFDPRSNFLNTELGFVIESESLASEVEQGFASRVPEMAYRLHLDEKARLYWTETDSSGVNRCFTSEPRTPLWRRWMVRLLSILPFEWLV